MSFGKHIRLLRVQNVLSIRALASKVDIEFGYLSRIEREEVPPPSEAKVIALATVLNEDPDTLLAMAGKVSPALVEIICRRPHLFASLLRNLKDTSDQDLYRLSHKVRDGDW